MSEGTEGTFMLVPDWTPPTSLAPTHPTPDKRHLYSPWAWKPLWGLLSLYSYAHIHTENEKKKKNMCAPWCGKFVHDKQSVSVCSYGGTHTHTHTQEYISMSGKAAEKMLVRS